MANTENDLQQSACSDGTRTPLSSAHSHSRASSLAFEPVLELFGTSHLAEELRRFKRIQHAVSLNPKQAQAASELVDDFLMAFETRSSEQEFAVAVSRMWPAHRTLRNSEDVVGLQLAVHRRRVMLTAAAAWYWLTQDCVARCRTLVDVLDSSREPTPTPDHWLDRLCHRLYVDVVQGTPGSYDAHDFLPTLDGSPTLLEASLSPGSDASASTIVCENVVRMLRAWLNFPSNVQMLAGHFVMYVVGAFKNPDVLLLNGVWKVYRSTPTSILGRREKAHRVDVAMMDDFARRLRNLPLADVNSSATAILNQISAAVEECAPGLRVWTASMFKVIVPGEDASPPLPPPSGPSAIPAFTHPLGPPAIPAAVPDGPLDRLLAFALHILPIARNRHLSSPSPLQQRVLDRSDHYLPFRELASSRQQVTGPGGPFHPSVRCQSGAFPSWLIFRALMFDSPILHAGRTRCYFPNEAAWNRFLLDEDFNANDV